ncbi:DUF6520 family protein [Aequorivita marisscotiae]|uniref:DUF6520 family protein n=1 Tax=Aequorivita marisscotiae TaxID=3040348 RepID=A0ABY8KVV2_9FLAO|nr:DUF6520 family protein [Aequorivita sp. Ant34-E75]WGF92180.1 DUF6520 family protein [Aequorivita sp. Ant34-E75]
MKNLISKIVLPIAVFMVAIVAAFASKGADSENTALEQGYIHASTPCEVSIECSPNGLTVCKVGSKQVFGMNAASQCTRTLYLPIQN